MAWNDKRCPCGGTKEPDTLLCQACLDRADPTMTRVFNDETKFPPTRRQSAAIRLLVDAVAQAITLDAITGEPEYIESRRGFDRYATGPAQTTWICGDCGHEVADPETGCQRCGYGTPDTDNDNEAR